MDDLIVMNGPSLAKFLPTLKKGGLLFINSSIVYYQNCRLGIYLGYTEVIDLSIVWETIEHKLASKPKLRLSINRLLKRALRKVLFMPSLNCSGIHQRPHSTGFEGSAISRIHTMKPT